MFRPTNPYVTDKPVSASPVFVGRVDILHDIDSMLHDPKTNAIALYGQRRIGKTSILEYLNVHLPTHSHFCPVYFDLHDKVTWSLEQVICELAHRIADTLNQTLPDLGDQPEFEFIDSWLPEILKSLPEETVLVLLFDEFDVLPESHNEEQAGNTFFPYLRQLLYHQFSHLKFVFAVGRNVDDLDNIAVYLFKGIPPLRRLSLLSQTETESLVRLSEAEQALDWSDEAVERTWQYTQGHPLLTQQICFCVWEKLYRADAQKPSPVVIPGDVENVILQVLERSDKALDWLWDSLPPTERIVGAALAEVGPAPITLPILGEFLDKSIVGIFTSDLLNAPTLLHNWEWLKLINGGYCFRVELLRYWVTKQKPFQQIQEKEMDRLDPVADLLFHEALDWYKGGQLTPAFKQLHEVIVLNPNHIGARQTLAEILLDQGQTEEANIHLTKLYQYKPVIIRPRLIAAFLTLAEQMEDEEKQLHLYDQVLTLEPQQPDALAKGRKIGKQLGEQALAKDDLKTALNIYKKLGINNKVSEIEQEIFNRFFDLKEKSNRFKRRKNYQISTLILLILIFGIWIFFAQTVEKTSLQQVEQLLEKKVQLEKRIKQAHTEKASLEKQVEETQQKNTQLTEAFNHLSLKRDELEKERATFSRQIELENLISQLEKGDQVVIVGSYRQQQDAEKQAKKLKATYPILFYPQFGLLPKNHVYQKNHVWEIVISGFYSLKSAQAMRKKLLELEIVEDAFIRKDPFREHRRLPF